MEMAKMEDLGRTAKILEHRLIGQSSIFTNAAVTAVNSISTSNSSSSSSSSVSSSHQNNNSSENQPAASSWKTIAKRDKRKKKIPEKQIMSEQVAGHIGTVDRTVEELTMFIQSVNKGSSNSHKNNRIINSNNKLKSQQQQQQQNINRNGKHPQTHHQNQQPIKSHPNNHKPTISPNNLSQVPAKKSESATSTKVSAAVTFAHHLKVHDDDVPKYVFGFFDDQQKKQIKPSKGSNPVNFNYDQILKYISHAWESSQSARLVK